MVSKSIVMVAALCILCGIFGHVIKEKRSVSSEISTNHSEEGSEVQATTPEVPICEWSYPCGWGIYDKFSREIQYFIKNHDCKCKENTLCIRDDDDISIPGYIYRCREVPANATVKEDSLWR